MNTTLLHCGEPIAGLRVGVSLGTSLFWPEKMMSLSDLTTGPITVFVFPKPNDGWLDSILRHYWWD
jgi:hypothetical protein